MKQETSLRKKMAVREAEKAGNVADSMEVRMALIARVHAGEITLEQAQAELKKIKAYALKNGKTTRSSVFRKA